MVLVHQIVRGLILTLFYKSDRSLAFSRVQFIIFDVMHGWLVRIRHFNGASLFFLVLYLHVFKGLFFFSYRLVFVWRRGLTLIILFMAEAFIGYVLVWGQIRFWAAIVITSLLSVIPYLRTILLLWVWGGFSVNNSTLGIFFILHFLLPFLGLLVVLFHLVSLHRTGRTSLLYCFGDYDKVIFIPYFWLKDRINIICWLLFYFIRMRFPFVLGDKEIFIEANNIVRPVHIVPEWYFLFVYAVLRSIPNKTLGVVALIRCILALFYLILWTNYNTTLDIFNNTLVLYFLFVCISLTWIGQCSVESPFIIIGQIISVLYFTLLEIISKNNYINKFL